MEAQNSGSPFIINVSLDLAGHVPSVPGSRICGRNICGFSDSASKSKNARERQASTRKLTAAVALCLIFMSVEVVGGVKANSLAILTDAAHLLSDVATFAISLFSIWASGWEATPRQSYGFFRIEILGAMVSIQLIWLLTGILIYEAVIRLVQDTVEVNGFLMFIIATFGLAVNVVMAVLLGHDHSHGHGHGWHSHHHDGNGHGYGHSHNDDTDHSISIVTHQPNDAENREYSQPLIQQSEQATVRSSRFTGTRPKPGNINAHSHSHSHSHSHGDNSEHSTAHSTSIDAGQSENPEKSQLQHSEQVAVWSSSSTETKPKLRNINVHSHGLTAHSTIINADESENPEILEPLIQHSEQVTVTGSSSTGTKPKPRNINLHSAYIHVLGDSIQSIGVMIGGGIIWWKPELKIIDLICTLSFSLIVLATTLKMVRSILEVLMESTPREVDATELERGLCQLDGIVAVHELHIWAITVGKVLLACHVMVSSDVNADGVLDMVIEYIKKEHNISHVTIQIERL